MWLTELSSKRVSPSCETLNLFSYLKDLVVSPNLILILVFDLVVCFYNLTSSVFP